MSEQTDVFLDLNEFCWSGFNIILFYNQICEQLEKFEK